MLKNKLKSWRHRMEMNQTEFAAFLGANKNQYSRWERQEIQPSLEWAWIIAKKLNCRIEDLFEAPE
ncbi:MAG: helix-turn-helix domain-containing protein [Negativicutes bacterium]|nr:helix-turn-helix domain-containing protein [Negativicutes bacterium]